MQVYDFYDISNLKYCPPLAYQFFRNSINNSTLKAFLSNNLTFLFSQFNVNNNKNVSPSQTIQSLAR